MKNWKINSWRNYPVKHIPEYPDKKELDRVLSKINDFPPLVFAGETRHLKEQLAQVVDGKAFLLTIPLQKLAYYSALKKGYDIDKPRNLAKSVTVE